MANFVHFPFDSPGGPNQRLRFGSRQVGSGLTKALCFLTFLNEGGGVKVVNLVDGKDGVFSGTTPPVWRNNYLRTASATGGTPGVDFGATPQTADLALGAFTFVARCRPDTAGFAASGGIARRNDGNTVNAGWQIIVATGGTILTIERATTNFSSKTTVALTADKFQTLAIVYMGDLTAANTEIYYDGVPQAHTSDNNGIGAQGSDATQNLFLGQANFTNNGIGSGVFGGSIDWAGIWRRRLRREEIVQLSQDPYVLVRPSRFTSWVFFNKQTGAGSASGDATANATPSVAGSASGDSTAAATGNIVGSGAGAASGDSTASGVPAVAGSASGDSTAAATGVLKKTGAGSADGDSTATGGGTAHVNSFGEAEGDSAAAAVGRAITFDYDAIDWSDCAVKIGGVAHEVRAETLAWEENYSSVPPTARFRLVDVEPTIGAEVQIIFGGELKVFGGYITNVRKVQEDIPYTRMTRYDVSAVGYAWLYSLVTANRQFKNSSPGGVSSSLAGYVQGIAIASSDLSGVVDDVTFSNSQVSEALTQMANAGGGMWRVEPDRSFHAFQVDESYPPDDVTPEHPSILRFGASEDLTQYVNRVRVEGGGTNALADGKDSLFSYKEVPVANGLPIVEVSQVKVNGRLYSDVSVYRHGITTFPVLSFEPVDDGNGPFNSGDTAQLYISAESQFGETILQGVAGGGIGGSFVNGSLRYFADPVVFGAGSDDDPANSGAGPISRINIWRTPLFPDSNDSTAYLVTSYDPREGIDYLDTMSNEQLQQQLARTDSNDTSEVDILRYTNSESLSEGFTEEDDQIKSGDAINVFAVASEASQLSAILGVSNLSSTLDLQDGRLTYSSAVQRAGAELAARRRPIQQSVEYECYDMKNRPGRVVHVDMPAPTSVEGDFVVRRVSYSWVKTFPQLPPLVKVQEATPYGTVASYTIEKILQNLMRPPVIGRDNATTKMPALKELKPPSSPSVPPLFVEGTFTLHGGFKFIGGPADGFEHGTPSSPDDDWTFNSDAQTDSLVRALQLKSWMALGAFPGGNWSFDGSVAGTSSIDDLPPSFEILTAQLEWLDTPGGGTNLYGGDEAFVNAGGQLFFQFEEGQEQQMTRSGTALVPSPPWVDSRYPGDSVSDLFTRGFGARYSTDGSGVAAMAFDFKITGTYRCQVI